jgi:Rho termination factor, N-terminal domain
MKLDEIKKIAEQYGIKPGKMKKADLVREIQKLEGNNSCYDTGQSESCGQAQCSWRVDCD